jgi:hypothetical protein
MKSSVVYLKDMKLRLKSHPQIVPQILAIMSSEHSTLRLQYGTRNKTWKIKTTSEQDEGKMIKGDGKVISS